MKPETALPAARVGGMRWALEAGVHMSLDATPRKPDDERASAAAPDADDDDDDDDEQAGARLRGYAIVAAVAPTRAPPPWRAELVGGTRSRPAAQREPKAFDAVRVADQSVAARHAIKLAKQARLERRSLCIIGRCSVALSHWQSVRPYD